MKELVIKKCLKCGSIIKVIEDCTCGDCEIMCCNNPMKTLEINSTDASFEKHIPTYEKKDNKIVVNVNHVMEDEHFIKWICLVTEEKEEYRNFEPNKKAICEFDNVESGILYSYCNKHGLWKNNI